MIKVYGKSGCGLCEAAKDKLRKMGFEFESCDLPSTVKFHEGWRSDDAVEVLATYTDIGTMPVIVVDGEAMSYPESMRLLKKSKPAAEPLRLPTRQPEPELELALA